MKVKILLNFLKQKEYVSFLYRLTIMKVLEINFLLMVYFKIFKLMIICMNMISIFIIKQKESIVLKFLIFQ